MEQLIEDVVETLIGTPVGLAITIPVASLLLMNVMWWANTRKKDRNVGQHVGSMVGVAVLSVAIVLGINWVQDSKDAAADTDKEPKKMQAIEASIAQKTSPHKQPQKKFREPDPVKPPEGISHDD